MTIFDQSNVDQFSFFLKFTILKKFYKFISEMFGVDCCCGTLIFKSCDEFNSTLGRLVAGDSLVMVEGMTVAVSDLFFGVDFFLDVEGFFLLVEANGRF